MVSAIVSITLALIKQNGANAATDSRPLQTSKKSAVVCREIIVHPIVALEEVDRRTTKTAINNCDRDIIGRHDLVSHYQSPLPNVA
jgi:hypothetical protein